VKNARARHCATADGRYPLVFDASACTCRIVAKHRWFRGETRHGILPIDRVVRCALIAHGIIVFVGIFLREICKPATGICKEAPE
jgi:hypothetical protein